MHVVVGMWVWMGYGCEYTCDVRGYNLCVHRLYVICVRGMDVSMKGVGVGDCMCNNSVGYV